jgi:hypothetical protein
MYLKGRSSHVWRRHRNVVVELFVQESRTKLRHQSEQRPLPDKKPRREDRFR